MTEQRFAYLTAATIVVEVKDPLGKVLTKTYTEDAVISLSNKPKDAAVTYEYGMTIPTVAYGNSRIGITLQVMCNLDDIDSAVDQAEEWVKARVAAEAQHIKGMYS